MFKNGLFLYIKPLTQLSTHPYTTIEYVQRDLQVNRLKASRILEAIVTLGLLRKIRDGRRVYFVNDPLVDILK